MGSSALITRNTDLKVAMPDLPLHWVHGDGYRQTKAEGAGGKSILFSRFFLSKALGQVFAGGLGELLARASFDKGVGLAAFVPRPQPPE